MRAAPNGGIVRVKDVARVELGAQDYYHDRPPERQARGGRRRLSAAGLQCRRTPLRPVKQRMEKRRVASLDDVDYPIALDTTRAVTEGMREIVRLCWIAVAAGRSWYLSVPAGLARHADPVAGGAGIARRHVHLLPGLWLLDQHAFAVRLVLAIGLVVDDAIVVVEAYSATSRRA